MKNYVVLSVIFAVIATVNVSRAEDYSIPLEDNYKTLFLWNMNAQSTLSDGKVITYDQVAYLPRTNRHLRYQNGSLNGGTLVSGQSTAFGKAAQFDGIDDYGLSFASFAVKDSFKLEAWVNVDSTTAEGSYLIDVQDSWFITISDTGTRINLYVADETGTFGTYRVRLAITPNSWKHITVGFENGTASMSIDGTTQTGSADLSNTSLYNSGAARYVYLARKTSGSNYFKGLIDDVRLSYPEAAVPASVYSDTVRGTQALYHFDDTISSGTLFPDDDSTGTRTPMDITAYNSPTVTDDGIYPNDDAAFAGHVNFDGMSHYLRRYNFIGIDPTNFRVETWVKMEPDWWTSTVGRTYYIARKDPTFRLYASIHTANVPQMNLTIYDTSTGVSVAKTIYYRNCKFLKWTHVAAEYYGGVAKLYINGALATSVAVVSTSIDDNQILSVGSNLNANMYWGSLDDLRISNAVMPAAQCGDFGYLQADLSRNCVVDIADLEILVGDWLKCTADEPGCVVVF